MNRERAPCMHTKVEEQNICLEDACIKNQEFKLDCFKCLKKTHPHESSIFHIQEIFFDAEQNQQQIRTQIYENFEFCSNLKHTLSQNILEMKQKLTSLVDQVGKQLLGEIEKYEYQLTEQKHKIEGVQLKKDQLKSLIEYKLMDYELYRTDNINIQKCLQENQTTFNSFFNMQYDKLFGNFQLEQINQKELPKIQFQKIVNTQFQYEKCNALGCSNMPKNQFCLEESCLQVEGKKFECPMCLTKQHVTNTRTQFHTEKFVSGEKLWEQQDQLIDDIILYINTKCIDIEDESKELLQVIAEYSQYIEQKLQVFKKFIIDKKKEILDRLVKFKTQYQKGDFIVHRELFLMKDNFSVIGDIVELENKFKSIALSFKKQYGKEKNISQEQFQDQWLQGLSIMQSENIYQLSEQFINPVSRHIQELNDIICKLTKEISEQNEKKKTQPQQQMPQNFQNDQAPFQQLKQKIQQVSNQIINLNEKQHKDTQLILNAISQLNKQQVLGENFFASHPARSFRNQ